jgi:hypothetical protein
LKLIISFLLAVPLLAAEADALRISANIQARHMPYGTIIDPVWRQGAIVSYSRGGDSAIWTGHYLAAEAFRYKVTAAPQALVNVQRALAGIQSLVDVTQTDLLARVIVPVDSPFATDITNEERHHGVRNGTLPSGAVYWIGNTSRDQYLGVFFGLSVAYEFVEDGAVRATVSALGTRMLDFLLDHNWNVVMPDGRISTTFINRPDQQLALLLIGRQINPARFDRRYRDVRWWYSLWVGVPIAAEALDPHGSYFKFNLDAISFYTLVRLEDDRSTKSRYTRAYDTFRNAVGDHGNAHFNMIDRVLRGPDARRDAETRDLLEAWLRRPAFDHWVDLRDTIRACGEDRACEPIPVEQRVRTDFLWQRSPFLLYGGGAGETEGAGIDYILPYWMARYYGVL